jgi:hypothetical protein
VEAKLFPTFLGLPPSEKSGKMFSRPRSGPELRWAEVLRKAACISMLMLTHIRICFKKTSIATTQQKHINNYLETMSSSYRKWKILFIIYSDNVFKKTARSTINCKTILRGTRGNDEQYEACINPDGKEK